MKLHFGTVRFGETNRNRRVFISCKILGINTDMNPSLLMRLNWTARPKGRRRALAGGRHRFNDNILYVFVRKNKIKFRF